MIITKVQGGLGNQLFQYAYARAVGAENNQQIYTDRSYYPTTLRRQYKLDQLNIRAFDVYQQPIGLLCPVLVPKIGQYWLPVFRHLQKDWEVFIEPDHQPLLPLPTMTTRNLYLSGFWQKYSYIAGIRTKLKKEIQLQHPSPLLKKLLEPLKKPTIGIHVRRGDYQVAKGFGMCSEKYYQHSLQRIQQLTHCSQIIVCSDDIPWCQRTLHLPRTTRFIQETTSDLEDFTLLRACTHWILSNSTFSWWAAWLGEQKNSVVVAPSPWLDNPKIDTTGLLPKPWITIPKR